MKPHRIYSTSFASVYPHYVTKVEKRGHTTAELHHVIEWLTGYDSPALARQIETKVDFEGFFDQAPAMNPAREKIKGMICGIRVEDIQEPLMQEIRYLDKLVDELARGKKMENILRS